MWSHNYNASLCIRLIHIRLVQKHCYQITKLKILEKSKQTLYSRSKKTNDNLVIMVTGKSRAEY